MNFVMRNVIFHFKKKFDMPTRLEYHNMKLDLSYCKIQNASA